MKKKRITYGVYGMMEYQSIIRFGKNTLKVTFTDGSMNATGVTPATFSTSDFFIQQAIENSEEYKRGRIRVVRFTELDEDLRIERAEPTEADSGENIKTPVPETEIRTPFKLPEKMPSVSGGQPDKGENTEALTEVEFPCNDDAKDYLEQKFGFVRSKLHNREDIINAGKSRGVIITFV